MKKILRLLLIAGSLSITGRAQNASLSAPKPAAVGTSKDWGAIDGVSMIGLVHLDEALKGKLTEIRKTGKFSGHALETMLIEPPAGSMKAKKLLLIGLGNRNTITPELMTSIASVATREALRLGLTSFAFASDLKDGGIDSPTALVAGNVVKGIVNAYRSEEYLQSQGLTQF